jgi:peptidoglycan/LPS O-acetylase OafA/YrhL
MANEKRNFGLDIARALAITLVFSNHLMGVMGIRMGVFWYLAYLGVDIFFALSGFLIGGILIDMCDKDRGALTFSQTLLFLIRRWLRTVPLYFVALLANFIVGKYILRTVHSLNWKYLLWLQSFNEHPQSFFGESWSLCIEEWFYFLFALGLAVFTSLVPKRYLSLRQKVLWFTLLFIAVITILRITLSDYNYLEFNVTIFRLDAIAYGVLFAIANKFYKIEFNSIWIGLLALVFSTSGILLFLSHDKIGNIYMLYYNLAGIGLGLSVFFLKLTSDWFRKHSYWAGITFISKVSYSIYLFNLIIIFLMSHFLRHWTTNTVLTIFCFFATILLSFCTYKFIEVPFLAFRDKHFRNRRPG